MSDVMIKQEIRQVVFLKNATCGATCSFYRCNDHTPNRTKGDEFMLDDFIRRMVQAVIESFPIDETKKTDILRHIMNQSKIEEDQ